MHTKTFSKAVAIAMAAAASGGIIVSLSACVDNKYDVKTNDIDLSAQFAPGGLTIPLATLERKTLGEYIDKENKENMDYLQYLADGGMVITQGDKVSTDLSADDFRTPTFDVTVPAVTPITIAPPGDTTLPTSVAFSFGQQIETNVPDLAFGDNATTVSQINHTTPGQIPGGISGDIPMGTEVDGEVDNGEAQLVLAATMPKEIKRLELLEFGTTGNDAATGALVRMSFDTGSKLAGVFNRIKFTTFEVVLPERYHIVNPTGGAAITLSHSGASADPVIAANNNKLSMAEHTHSDPNNPMVIEFYIDHADMHNASLTPTGDGKELGLAENISYDINYSLTVNAGTVPATGNGPSVTIFSQPTFKDATFTTEAIDFKLPATGPDDVPGKIVRPIDAEIGGFPAAVQKVNRVPFASPGNSIFISLEKLGLPFTSVPNVKITFPKIFKFAADPGKIAVNGDGTTTMTLSTTELAESNAGEGYEAKLNSVEFGAGEGIPVAGKIDLSVYNVVVELEHTFPEEQLTWSALSTPAQTVDFSAEAPSPGLKLGSVAVGTDVIIDDTAISAITSGNDPIEIDETFSVPEQAVSVDRVLVSASDTGEKVVMKLEINIKNQLVNTIALNDVRIEIPEFVILTPGQPGMKPGNVFEPDAPIVITKQSDDFDFTLAQFEILGFDHITVREPSGPTETHTGSISGELTYFMQPSVQTGPGETIGTADMIVTPKITLPEIAVNRVYGDMDLPLEDYMTGEKGKIDPVLLPTELIELLGDSKNPGLASPIIRLQAKNPTGISLVGNMTLTPKDKDGNTIRGGTVSIDNFKLAGGKGTPPADDQNGEKATYSKLYITGDDGVTAPDGWELRYIPNLMDLVREIPASIEIDVTGNSDQTADNFIETGRGYTFDVEYSVELPLRFGSDMDLDLTDTVTGLNEVFKTMADFKIMARDIVVVAAMNYSFPLRIGHHDAAETVAMQFLDANNVPVPGLTAVITGALVGSETGPANGLIEPGKNYSELRIALHAPNGGDLSMLSTIEKLKWTIPLSAAANSVDLNSADYVEGRVWLELNSGLEIDIKELLNSLNSGDDDGGDDGGDGGQQQ